MLYVLVAVTSAIVAAAATFVVSRHRAPTSGAVDALLSAEVVRAVVESAPTAIVVYRDAGEIAYANATARELFFEGGHPEGTNLLALLGQAPEALRNALLSGGDDLFTVEQDGERETYHLAKRTVAVRGEPHTLLLVRHLTQELNRREVEIWKRLIRALVHELNNSLAPISSLMHSARLLVQSGPEHDRLERVFATVGDRAEHLRTFLEGYARFARMPAPRREHVEWSAFVEGLRELYPHARCGELPAARGFFDRAQLQQVLINLMKNAEEAGSRPEEVTLDVLSTSEGARIEVSDRGPGMSEEVMRNALLPFYSTKERGTGLGLALCQEIIEAHGGRLRIRNREGGGLVVSCSLPPPDRRAVADKARLTLTQA